jgi:hypothetical protein
VPGNIFARLVRKRRRTPMDVERFLDKWMPLSGTTATGLLEDREKMRFDLEALVGGLIERKMNCPNCGPKFKKRYERFVNVEVPRRLRKESTDGK